MPYDVWFAVLDLLCFPLTEILLPSSKMHNYNVHIFLDVIKKYILKQFLLNISFSTDVLFPEHLLYNILFMILSFTKASTKQFSFFFFFWSQCIYFFHSTPRWNANNKEKQINLSLKTWVLIKLCPITAIMFYCVPLSQGIWLIGMNWIMTWFLVDLIAAITWKIGSQLH